MSLPNLRKINGNYSHKNGLNFKANYLEGDDIILCLWSDKNYTNEQIANFLQALKNNTITKL